jgi:taurine dioxygenase
MAYETIEVNPLSPVIGAEIEGVDISKPLGNQTFREVHDALMEHQVIFFRDQEMNWDEHKAFGRMFGELHIHPSAPKPKGHSEILVIHADENSKVVAGMKWHSDVSCDVEPPMGSILHIHELPPVGGDTMFASMYAAYDALSEPIKAFIDGKSAWHESIGVHLARFGHKGESLRDADNGYPEALHPIVRTHPVTGRKALFVNENFTTRIEGLKKNESDAILKMLYDHIATPEFHCRFRWREKSVAFWDNRSAQHRTVWDYFPQVRHGYRVTIRGDKPF